MWNNMTAYHLFSIQAVGCCPWFWKRRNGVHHFPNIATKHIKRYMSTEDRLNYLTNLQRRIWFIQDALFTLYPLHRPCRTGVHYQHILTPGCAKFTVTLSGVSRPAHLVIVHVLESPCPQSVWVTWWIIWNHREIGVIQDARLSPPVDLHWYNNH